LVIASWIVVKVLKVQLVECGMVVGHRIVGLKVQNGAGIGIGLINCFCSRRMDGKTVTHKVAIGVCEACSNQHFRPRVAVH